MKDLGVPQCLPLVDAWNIPDHILRAPIGLSSNDPYSEYLDGVGWRWDAPAPAV